MKKLILALFAAASLTSANAQKNSILLYGNVGINADNRDMGATGSMMNTAWNVNPGIGIQFNEHWTVGLQGGVGVMMDKQTNPFVTASGTTIHVKHTANEMDMYQAGVFLRHTHWFNNMFGAFHQLDVSYIGGESKTAVTSTKKGPNGEPTYNMVNDNYKGFAAMITPALAINVYKGLCLNFSIGGIGYRMENWTLNSTTPRSSMDNNAFMFTFGQQFNMGISMNFADCMKKHHGGGHMEPGMDTRKMKKHSADEDDE